MMQRDDPKRSVSEDFEDTQVLFPADLAPPSRGEAPPLAPHTPARADKPADPARTATPRPPARDTREIILASRARWHPAPWLVAGLATGAGLAGLVWLLFVALESGDGDAYPTAAIARSAPVRAAAHERLRDRGGAVGLEADGRLVGIEAVAPNVRRAVAEALQSGRFPENPEIQAVLASLRVPAAADPGPRLLAPVATRLLAERPRFAWSDHPAATDYQVTVVDRLGNPIVESPRLRELAWEPTRPLPRGRPLVWNLATRVRRGETEPPVAEARFALLSAEDLAFLDREIRAAGDSYLVSAVLYAELGALDDCHDALVELARLNPGAAVVGRLLADLQAKRGG